METRNQEPIRYETAYKYRGIPLVKCPHCDRVNGFPKLDEVWMFACHYCGQSVGVTRTVNVDDKAA
ncbi:MAG TPA: hypothetical protein VH302_16375 [Bryobacteraceae bacterium]|nr:hypothetical protein [Bryobacteraceae bacterium]